MKTRIALPIAILSTLTLSGLAVVNASDEMYERRAHESYERGHEAAERRGRGYDDDRYERARGEDRDGDEYHRRSDDDRYGERLEEEHEKAYDDDDSDTDEAEHASRRPMRHTDERRGHDD